MDWPDTPEQLEEVQRRLGGVVADVVGPLSEEQCVGGVFVCFGRGGSGPGRRGEPGWAGAVSMQPGRLIGAGEVEGAAGAPYAPGLLALREGALLEAAIRELPTAPDVVLVNATGRDHPRRAGLALHLGAVLGVPTVGVTHRPLVAASPWPGSDRRGAHSPLLLGGDIVGVWLRTRDQCRPLAIHAAWRTDPESAASIVLATTGSARTPEPLRQARHIARLARNRGSAPCSGVYSYGCA